MSGKPGKYLYRTSRPWSRDGTSLSRSASIWVEPEKHMSKGDGAAWTKRQRRRDPHGDIGTRTSTQTTIPGFRARTPESRRLVTGSTRSSAQHTKGYLCGRLGPRHCVGRARRGPKYCSPGPGLLATGNCRRCGGLRTPLGIVLRLGYETGCCRGCTGRCGGVGSWRRALVNRSRSRTWSLSRS